MMTTSDGATLKCRATTRTTASFALPSTAEARTQTSKIPGARSMICSLLDPGCARMVIFLGSNGLEELDVFDDFVIFSFEIPIHML